MVCYLMSVFRCILFPYMKHQYRQNNRQSKAIEEFNKKCAEERERQKIDSLKKYHKRVHNYVIDTRHLLGTGTFSSVYKGKDINKGKEVAVKVIELKTIQKMGIKQLFWEELNIIQQLRHPNIVTCLEYFRTPNNCYTIYEFCQGGDLASIINQGPLGEKEYLHQANNFIKDIFQGLLYLETMSIIHRDIKGANILISRGKAKIGDFGFATRCKSDFKDASIGSPAYMSPEGLHDNIYGPKTDVWAFGILVYEILHGFSPFHLCQNEKELKKQIQIPVNWDQLKASLPSSLKRMILKCLKVNSFERPTFSDLLTDDYIQKLYQCSLQVKVHEKSNYSKGTADSEKILQSVSLSIIPNEKNIEETEITQHQGTITIGRARSLEKRSTLEEEFDVIENESRIQLPSMKKSKEPEKQEQFILQKVKIETFLFVPPKLSMNEGENWMSVFLIFSSALIDLQSISLEESEYKKFKNIFSQLSTELYWSLKTSNLKVIEQFLKVFAQTSLINEEMKQFKSLSMQTIQTIFLLIKKLQNLIDKHDLSSQKSKALTQNLINCGNNLILCYRIFCSLIKKQPFQESLLNSKTKNLNSSQQFYIWLYEIELQEMEIQQEEKTF